MKKQRKIGSPLCSDPQLGSLLLSYSNGGLPADLHQKVSQHIVACKRCTTELGLFCLAKEWYRDRRIAPVS
jgi:hypothetical protein